MNHSPIKETNCSIFTALIRNQNINCLFFIVAAASFNAACSDSDSKSTPELDSSSNQQEHLDSDITVDALDAGSEEENLNDSSMDSSGPALDMELSPSDSGESSCRDFTGAYLLQGECSIPQIQMMPAACVRQTECEATLLTDLAQFSGQSAGESATLSSDSPISQTCTVTADSDSTHLSCAGDELPFTCEGSAQRVEIPEVLSLCCDPVAQDCGAGEKCSMVAIPGSEQSVSACLPESGARGLREACSRTPGIDPNWGRDDCAAGFYCSPLEATEEEGRTCLKFCRQNSDCDQNNVCLLFSDGGAPSVGTCTSICDPFNAECIPGRTCVMLHTPEDLFGAPALTPICGRSQGKEEGEACVFLDDCAEGLACEEDAGEKRCLKLCDATHPCPDEGACAPMSGALREGDTYGVCPAPSP